MNHEFESPAYFLGKAVPFNTLAGVLSSGSFQLLQCYIGLDVKRLGKYYCLIFRQRYCIQAHAGQGASLVSILQVCCPLPGGGVFPQKRGHTTYFNGVPFRNSGILREGMMPTILPFGERPILFVLLSKQPTLPMRTLLITSGRLLFQPFRPANIAVYLSNTKSKINKKANFK